MEEKSRNPSSPSSSGGMETLSEPESDGLDQKTEAQSHRLQPHLLSPTQSVIEY